MCTVSRIFVMSGLALLAASSFAAITATVDVANGVTVSGIKKFTVKVTTKATLSDVEFYVNNDIRGSDETAPYEFELDTVAEKEGPIEVKILAFNVDGEKSEIKLKLTIDNEIGKGADFHVGLGQEAVTDQKWDEALLRGRIALKAKPKYNPARMLVARASFGTGVYDTAQKFIEDVLAEEPNNIDALDLSSAVRLQQAFNVQANSREQIVDVIGKALKGAATSRAKVYGLRLDNFGKVTPENRLKFADLATRAARYGLVTAEFESLYRTDLTKTSTTNRYLYALMRGNRWKSALDVATAYKKRGNPDAAGLTLIAIAFERSGLREASLEAEKEALRYDPSDLTLRSGQIYLSLFRGQGQAFLQLVNDLAKDESTRVETIHYMGMAADINGDYELARKQFQTAILADPAGYDTYIQRGNQLLAYSTNPNAGPDDVKFDRAIAKTTFEAALLAFPESGEALTGISLFYAIDGNMAEALKYSEIATKAAPEYAAGHYTYSMMAMTEGRRYRNLVISLESQAEKFRFNDQKEEEQKSRSAAREAGNLAKKFEDASTKAIALANQLDKSNLEGRTVPDVYTAWRYFTRYGRAPYVILGQ